MDSIQCLSPEHYPNLVPSAVPNLVRQLSVGGSSGDMTASHEFSLSHDQGRCENFLVQDYVLWPITRLTQTELSYSQVPVQEQAGQASVVTSFALGLILCGFYLVTSIHSTSVHTSRTPRWLTRPSSSAESPFFKQN